MYYKLIFNINNLTMANIMDCKDILDDIMQNVLPQLRNMKKINYDLIISTINNLIKKNRKDLKKKMSFYLKASDSIYNVGLAHISQDRFDDVMLILSIIRVILLRGRARLSLMEKDECEYSNIEDAIVKLGLMQIFDWELKRVKLKNGENSDALKVLKNFDMILNIFLELSNEEAIKSYPEFKKIFEEHVR